MPPERCPAELETLASARFRSWRQNRRIAVTAPLGKTPTWSAGKILVRSSRPPSIFNRCRVLRFRAYGARLRPAGKSNATSPRTGTGAVTPCADRRADVERSAPPPGEPALQILPGECLVRTCRTWRAMPRSIGRTSQVTRVARWPSLVPFPPPPPQSTSRPSGPSRERRQLPRAAEAGRVRPGCRCFGRPTPRYGPDDCGRRPQTSRAGWTTGGLVGDPGRMTARVLAAVTVGRDGQEEVDPRPAAETARSHGWEKAPSWCRRSTPGEFVTCRRRTARRVPR